MDLRYPIGLLLTTYGAILAVRGLSVPELILGLNVNLYGGFMVACGLGALALAIRKA
jgi:hypothetical protein